MIEHRLIEKMVELIDKQRQRIETDNTTDVHFITTAVDFLRVYADKTHHGKEEDILFKALKNKNLSPEDKNLMEELMEEHRYGRKTVGELSDAAGQYGRGQTKVVGTIHEKLVALVNLYREHIKKEDERFFPSSKEYLDKDELDAMLGEFYEFDRKMLHEYYEQNVTEWEKKLSNT